MRYTHVHDSYSYPPDGEDGFFGHEMEDGYGDDDFFGGNFDGFFGGGGGFEGMNVEYSTSQGEVYNNP